MAEAFYSRQETKTRRHPLFLVIAFATAIISANDSGFAQSDLSSLPSTDEFNGTSLGSEYDILIAQAYELILEFDWGPAFKDLKRAMELNPDRAESYYMFGRAHLLREEYSPAERAFRKTLDVDPGFSEAWYEYARLMVLKGELNVALEAVNEAISLTEEKQPMHLVLLGEVYAEMGLRKSASQAFSDAMDLIKDQIKSLDKAVEGYVRGLEVVDIIETTHYVTDLETGEFQEIPVVRYQTQSVAAPKEWNDLRIRLEDELKSVKARKSEVLKAMKSG